MFRMLSRSANSRMRVYCAILVFLAVTVVFAFLYSVIVPSIEGSPSLRHNVKGVVSDEVITFVDCLYFSATTQATVGYRDIVPAAALGKICTILQAAFGYFYLAYMVTLLMARAERRPERRQDFLTGMGKTNKILRLR